MTQNAVVSQLSHLGLPTLPTQPDLLESMSPAVANVKAATRPSFSSVRPALPPLMNQKGMMNFLSDVRVPAPSFLCANLPVSSQSIVS